MGAESGETISWPDFSFSMALPSQWYQQYVLSTLEEAEERIKNSGAFCLFGYPVCSRKPWLCYAELALGERLKREKETLNERVIAAEHAVYDWLVVL